MNRDDLIKDGTIIPHDDLHDMYREGVQAPSWSQPWHQNDQGLRLDARGRYMADVDIMMSIEEDYRFVPPSMAAARRMLP